FVELLALSRAQNTDHVTEQYLSVTHCNLRSRTALHRHTKLDRTPVRTCFTHDQTRCLELIDEANGPQTSSRMPTTRSPGGRVVAPIPGPRSVTFWRRRCSRSLAARCASAGQPYCR